MQHKLNDNQDHLQYDAGPWNIATDLAKSTTNQGFHNSFVSQISRCDASFGSVDPLRDSP